MNDLDAGQSGGAAAAGVIYLVATPLGNLEDITLRALRILGEVSLIACEDTRRTGRLLQHFQISKPLVSCHDHNEARRATELAERAAAGESIALVSDAGTPLIADPGFRVVRAAIDRGVRVVPVPGPSAAVAALSVSGLPSHDFAFKGFLPPKSAKRRAAIRSLERSDSSTVFYEAPHRILAAVADTCELLGGSRRIAIARELTKLHEEVLRGPAASVLEALSARPSQKGEFVLVIGPADDRPASGSRSTKAAPPAAPAA